MSDETPLNRQELAALELFHQLVNLSPDDGEIALRLTLRLPNSRYVGDVVLSARDVECLIDSAMGMAMLNAAQDHLTGDDAAEPLPIDENEITGIGKEVETWLNGGPQQ